MNVYIIQPTKAIVIYVSREEKLKRQVFVCIYWCEAKPRLLIFHLSYVLYKPPKPFLMPILGAQVQPCYWYEQLITMRLNHLKIELMTNTSGRNRVIIYDVHFAVRYACDLLAIGGNSCSRLCLIRCYNAMFGSMIKCCIFSSRTVKKSNVCVWSEKIILLFH